MKLTITAFLFAILILTSCATRISKDDPLLVVVWGDAYALDCKEGQAVVQEGEIICPEGASTEVRGGHISEVFGNLLQRAVAIGAGFLPGGSDGHTHSPED
jgi:hypothetical protein